MFIVNSYSLAVIFCIVTMLCWGSWGNNQKLAGKSWRYELFYWDYVIGILLFSLVSAFTLGSMGEQGRSFLPDLSQATLSNIGSAFVGGVVFNAANILLAAAISIAGLSVAFPVGIGLALVLVLLLITSARPRVIPSGCLRASYSSQLPLYSTPLLTKSRQKRLKRFPAKD